MYTMNQTLHQLFDIYKQFKISELNSYYSKLLESLGNTELESNYATLNAKLVNKVKELTLPGKNIRGILFVLGYELSEKVANEEIYRASLMLELFHAGVLMHDDIMDKDTLRRGITTTHVDFEQYAIQHLTNNPHEYGVNMGINAGDLNILYGIGLFAQGTSDPANALKALQIYSYYTSRVVLGQVLDVSNFGENISSEYVEKVHQYKTAEYTGVMPLLMGATYAGISDKKILTALEKYGLSIGWAFQIKDDILGTFADSLDTGKPTDSDITEGKNTILVAQTLKQATPEDKTVFSKLYGKSNIKADEIQTIRKIFEKYNIQQTCEQIGQKYINDAKSQIPDITSNTKTQEILVQMADFFIERKS